MDTEIVSVRNMLIVSYRTLEKILDEKRFGEAVLMDLSKAFGFNNESLKLIQSYLTNRWQ